MLTQSLFLYYVDGSCRFTEGIIAVEYGLNMEEMRKYFMIIFYYLKLKT